MSTATVLSSCRLATLCVPSEKYTQRGDEPWPLGTISQHNQTKPKEVQRLGIPLSTPPSSDDVRYEYQLLILANLLCKKISNTGVRSNSVPSSRSQAYLVLIRASQRHSWKARSGFPVPGSSMPIQYPLLRTVSLRLPKTPLRPLNSRFWGASPNLHPDTRSKSFFCMACVCRVPPPPRVSTPPPPLSLILFPPAMAFGGVEKATMVVCICI